MDIKKTFRDMRNNYGRCPYFLLVLAGTIIFTLIFSAIEIWKYNAFSHLDFDFAIHLQKYWNILHGVPRISIIDDVSIWGNAVEVIAYFFSALYALCFCSPQAMLVIKVIILAGGAIPVFLIGKHAHSPKLGAAFALSYLLYPPLWLVALFDYFDWVLAGLLLLWAFYFLKTRRFGWYMACVLLTIACRLDMTLLTLMLGVYALLDKKSKRWWLLPIVISALWLYVGIFILLPRFKTNVNYALFYAHLGKTFPEIFRNMALRPGYTLSLLFNIDNGAFALQMLMPVGYFCVFGLKELMICLLNALQHLISLRQSEHIIASSYTIAMIPFVYISAIYGVVKFAGANMPRRIFSYIIILPIIANVIYGPHHHAQKELIYLMRENTARQKQRLLGLIPKDAPVICTFEFLSHLANRRYLYSFHYAYINKFNSGAFWTNVEYTPPKNIEYAILDFNDHYTMVYFREHDSDLNLRRFLKKNRLTVVDYADSIAVFKKNHRGGKKLYKILAAKTPSQEIPAATSVGNRIALESYDYSPATAGKMPAIKFSFAWRCLNKTADPLAAYIQFIDGNGKTRYETLHQLCYGIYPTKRWKKDQVIADYYTMSLPNYLKGTYTMRLVLISMENGAPTLFDAKKSKNPVNTDGSVTLGKITL